MPNFLPFLSDFFNKFPIIENFLIKEFLNPLTFPFETFSIKFPLELFFFFDLLLWEAIVPSGKGERR